mmetsp:Transcript_20003/g.62047  ORF Transcript_20003/g.62047 Transcript_20003/m.62047 type:complete len:280 (-) Transcript_20003:468-1307(-)
MSVPTSAARSTPECMRPQRIPKGELTKPLTHGLSNRGRVRAAISLPAMARCRARSLAQRIPSPVNFTRSLSRRALWHTSAALASPTPAAHAASATERVCAAPRRSAYDKRSSVRRCVRRAARSPCDCPATKSLRAANSSVWRKARARSFGGSTKSVWPSCRFSERRPLYSCIRRSSTLYLAATATIESPCRTVYCRGSSRRSRSFLPASSAVAISAVAAEQRAAPMVAHRASVPAAFCSIIPSGLRAGRRASPSAPCCDCRHRRLTLAPAGGTCSACPG